MAKTNMLGFLINHNRNHNQRLIIEQGRLSFNANSFLFDLIRTPFFFNNKDLNNIIRIFKSIRGEVL